MVNEQKTMKAVGYIRVSTLEQAQHGASLQVQREDITKYADYKRWQLVQVYEDAGISGSKADRPAFNNLMEEALRSKFNVIVCAYLSRFGRNLRDLVNNIQQLDASGVRLVCIKEGLDTGAKGTGRLMLHIMAALADWERELIRERMLDGKMAKRKDGRVYDGHPPYGYRYDKRKRQFVVVESEVAVYLRAVHMYMNEGLSLAAVALRLKEQGVLLRKKPFAPQSVRYMLKNTAYCGYMERNKYVYENRQRTKVLKPREQWIIYKLPALINRVQYDAIQQRMQRNRSKTKRDGKLGEYWLRDSLRCGVCGAVMRPRTKRADGKTYYYYECRWRCASNNDLKLQGRKRCSLPAVKAEDIHRKVWHHITQLLSFGANRGNIAKAIDPQRWDSRIKELTGTATKLESVIKEKRAVIDNLYGLLTDEQFSASDKEEFAVKRGAFKDEVHGLQAHLEEARRQLAKAEEAKENDSLYREFMENQKGTLAALAQQLQTLGPVDRKMLVESMLDAHAVLTVEGSKTDGKLDGRVLVDGNAKGWSIRPYTKPSRVNIGVLRKLIEDGKLGKDLKHYARKYDPGTGLVEITRSPN